MTIQMIRDQLPSYAKDIKLNLGNLLGGEGAEGLELNQVYGVALASAFATQQTDLIEAIANEAVDKLSNEEINAAKAAATIMGMNNIYYRFIHMSSDKEFSKMPAGLRMNVIGNPGIEKVDFELYALAVSAMNGCGMCIDAHVHEVLKGGITRQGVQSSIRIASVINATAQALVIQSVAS